MFSDDNDECGFPIVAIIIVFPLNFFQDYFSGFSQSIWYDQQLIRDFVLENVPIEIEYFNRIRCK